MNIKLQTFFYCVFLLFLLGIQNVSSAQKKSYYKPESDLLKTVDMSLQQSVDQYKFLMRQVPQDQLPRTYENGRLLTVSPYAWISGFYPGTLLYLYEFSGDSAIKREAFNRLNLLEKLQTVTANHDLGFMMYCSYGNAYRLTRNPQYKNILVRSAKSLATRFDPRVGCIKSWDQVKSLDGKTMLNFPVIIDNMMNLELLFYASRVTGDPYFRDIAVKHAVTTIENHLRPDYSCYHVINYDPETGEAKNKETQQGFSDNSTWSRGQAWGIYGFTMVYRETKDKKFLEVAWKMADHFLDHPNLPRDKVPYWDFNVNQPGFTPLWKYDPARYPVIPRDASAAAVTASALIELAGYVDRRAGEKYLNAAEIMLNSLSSPEYKASVGENGGFILKHSSGGVPGNVEVDVPLSYADYYFAEALMRYRAISKK
jgi:unsaturated chondroitin disaccharide hydrolase